MAAVVSGPPPRLVRTWPIEVPDHRAGGYAARVERERTARGDYPPEWPAVAWLVKVISGWRCERCRRPHSGTMADGFGLTVHHLDKRKWNLEHWNLAALCQRCHLHIESHVEFCRDWLFPHSPWMAVHVADYNEWARRQPCPTCRAAAGTEREVTQAAAGCGSCAGAGHVPLLSLVGVEERDYSGSWPAGEAVKLPPPAAGEQLELPA
jgi:hypothetical protein